MTSLHLGLMNIKNITSPMAHVKNARMLQPNGFILRLDALMPTEIAKASDIASHITANVVIAAIEKPALTILAILNIFLSSVLM